jgi:hypothetical protein
MLIASLLLVGSGRARAQSARVQADIQRAIADVQTDDRVQRALGAIAAQHVLKGRWRFSLLDRTELRWWQRALEPAIPHLIQMLADDSGLEWVDGQGMTEKVTTPRKEAALVLVGLERASVAPLIAALDRPDLTRKADQVLRQITGSGPPGSDRASWERWWQAHRGEPLPGEHGQLWKALLAMALLAAGITLVIWRQRRSARAAAARALIAPSP